MNARLLESLLAPDGHTVRTAGDGAKALRVVRAEQPISCELIKQHTVIGDRLCGELRSLRRVRAIVRHHHERLEGSGYPDGLRDEAIPLLAQIMGVVDVFDALMTERPYKAALPVARAADELRREAAGGWRSADLVAAFLDQVDRHRPGRPPAWRSNVSHKALGEETFSSGGR